VQAAEQGALAALAQLHAAGSVAAAALAAVPGGECVPAAELLERSGLGAWAWAAPASSVLVRRAIRSVLVVMVVSLLAGFARWFD
jgi:hypothetical protein